MTKSLHPQEPPSGDPALLLALQGLNRIFGGRLLRVEGTMPTPTFVLQSREACDEWDRLSEEQQQELVLCYSWMLEEVLLDRHDGRLERTSIVKGRSPGLTAFPGKPLSFF